MRSKHNAKNSCSEIIGPWRFSKESIRKMNDITDKTKIIERGGVLCKRTEGNIIDLISECKGTRCDIDVDPFKTCTDKDYIDTFGTFHTHPGEIMKTQPSAADLMSQKVHGMLICIGAPKAREDRIICIRNKHLSKVEEIERNKKLEDIYILERKIRKLPFYVTAKERYDYDKRFKDIFSEKYYYKFDPSKCIE